jgi:CRISPR-associated protein Cmr3
MGALASWLAGSQVVLDGQQSLRELPHDLRPHVAIDSSTLTGADGALFQSDGLDFDIGGADQGLIAWLHSPDAGARTHAAAGRCGRLGADGGSAMFERVQDNALRGLDCPPALKRTLDTLQVGDCLRLLLLTPACYLRNGWYPDGLRPNDPDQPDSPIEGCLAPLLVPPNKEDRARSGLHKDWRIDNPRNWRFRLRAAAVDRWLPLAGSNSRDDAGQAGFMRRPLRRLVPAGAVYWLQILRRGELPLSSLWMQSSCRTDFARDGFGLALPGLVRA